MSSSTRPCTLPVFWSDQHRATTGPTPPTVRQQQTPRNNNQASSQVANKPNKSRNHSQPFSRSTGRSGNSGGKGKGSGKRSNWLCCPFWASRGCLSHHWSAIGADPWVVSVLRDGYRIPFRDLPPPLTKSPVPSPTYQPDSERALALLAEIDTVMAKGVLEIVSDPDPGFYSRLLLATRNRPHPWMNSFIKHHSGWKHPTQFCWRSGRTTSSPQ